MHPKKGRIKSDTRAWHTRPSDVSAITMVLGWVQTSVIYSRYLNNHNVLIAERRWWGLLWKRLNEEKKREKKINKEREEVTLPTYYTDLFMGRYLLPACKFHHRYMKRGCLSMFFMDKNSLSADSVTAPTVLPFFCFFFSKFAKKKTQQGEIFSTLFFLFVSSEK